MIENGSETFVGTSTHSHRVRKFLGEAALSADPVLLLGEPGVGKELVARAI
ncbi:MAG TPA: sigma 54-interacting transcriptional regulator, partial [Planctomycetota bacterium]|nr:sigma 54-interacting transcriptional regulator [Planctomycetota bacterium]